MLSDKAVAAAKPKEKAWKLHDERGLYLFLTPAGAKTWRYDFRLHGKRRTITFGSYPDVSLAKARAKLQEARSLVADGQDPVSARRQSKALQRQSETFSTVATEWLKKQRGNPKTKRRARNYIDRHLAALARVPIAALTAIEVLGAIRPYEDAEEYETVRRLRQLVGHVMRYAVATTRAARDITVDLKGALAKGESQSHPAPTTPKEVGALLRAIESYEGNPSTVGMLKLAPLVFVRPGELRKMEWAELDIPNAIWRIPASKMKMKADHLVPLSRQALAILKTMPRRSVYVFPAARSNDRPLSDMTMNAALRALGFRADQIVGHGFRAMARTLLDEQLRYPPDVIEVQLAHTVRGPLGATYNRSLYWEQRVAMMQAYADYLDTLAAASSSLA